MEIQPTKTNPAAPGFQLDHGSLLPEPMSPLLAIAAGPTHIVASSAPLSWQGLLLEKHLTSPGERESAVIDRNVISMLSGSPARFDVRTVSGHFVETVSRPGALIIAPIGSVPAIRLHTSSEFVHCALDEAFTRGVGDELDRAQTSRPVFRLGIQDKAIRRILEMLVEELETDRPLGRLFVDSLAHALATRYLLLESTISPRSESRVSSLPPRILKRVVERIEANLETDVSLDTLAAESGYSRAHFLRMFRAATGLTPHQYVLDLRIRRAQDCLRQKDSSIIDVAVSCGFSSQSHMTTVFRQRLETTPAEYRRSA